MLTAKKSAIIERLPARYEPLPAERGSLKSVSLPTVLISKSRRAFCGRTSLLAKSQKEDSELGATRQGAFCISPSQHH
jgi:hypothetical protein